MVAVRPARPDDLATLNAWQLESGWELVDLARAIVFVAEEDGVPVGFIAGRMVFQVEPLYLRPMAKKMARRRATAGLARAMEAWLKEQPYPWARSYFCYIRDRVFQRLAVAFGLRRIYREGQFFLREM